MVWRKSLSYITRFLTLFLAYLCAVIPANYVRSWVAKKFGDSTAEDAGFLTFDPFIHIDPIGFICLAFFGLGWGRQTPVNPLNMTGKYRNTKIGITLFSGVLTNFILAIVALTALIVFFGTQVELVPSGLAFSTASVLVAFIGLNAFLIVIDFVMNLTVFLFLLLAEQQYSRYASYIYSISLFAPLLILLLFGDPLYLGILLAIKKGGLLLAALFGVSPQGIV